MDIQATRRPGYRYPGYGDTRLTRVLLATAIQATRNAPPSPVRQSMGITATQPTRATRATQPTQVPRVIGRHNDSGNPAYPRFARLWIAKRCRDGPPTPVLRAMDTKAARYTLPTPVPVTDIPAMVTRAVRPEDWPSGTEYGIEPAG